MQLEPIHQPLTRERLGAGTLTRRPRADSSTQATILGADNGTRHQGLGTRDWGLGDEH
jgi:hypothetical protein